MKHFAFICLSFSGSNYFLPVHRQASGTLRQFSDLQQYLSESEKGGGGSDLITLLSREGREISIDLIHAP